MKKFSLLFTSALLLIGFSSYSSSHLLWSSVEHHVNSVSNAATASATNGNGTSFIVNATEDGTSAYVTNRFLAYDSAGTKLWQFDGDSCLTGCHEEYNIVIPTSDNGAIFIGSYTDNTSAVQLRLIRLHSNGSLAWQQYWITPFLAVSPISSLLDHDGNLVVAVNATVDSLTLEDFIIAKFDTVAGLLSWFFQMPDAGQGLYPVSEVISSMTIDNQNTIFACGKASNSAAGVYDNYLFSVSSAGTLNYLISTGFSGVGTDVKKVLTDENDNLYVTGVENNVTYLQRYRASTSDILWSRQIVRDSANKVFGGMVISSDRLFVLDNYRYFHSNTSGGYWSNQHYMISIFDSTGSALGKVDYLTTLDASATQDGSGGAVQFSKTGAGMFVLSSQQLDNSGQHYAVIQKLDLNGNPMWYDTATINTDPGRIGLDNFDGVYLNFAYVPHSGIPYNYLNKYSDAIINATSQLVKSDNYSVSPNPFSSSIEIRNSINSKEQPVRYTVFTSSGTLVKSAAFSGTACRIDLSDLPSGAYFLRLQTTDNGTFTKLLIKQ